MRQYQELVTDILFNGVNKSDRTGVGTRSVFCRQLRFNLKAGFPLVTTKEVNFKAVVEELRWFLRGDTNIKSLNRRGVRIWDQWADSNGDLGPIYGEQWRNWMGFDLNNDRIQTIDQISTLIENIRKDPNDRAHIVSAWNVTDLPAMKLRPCHILFQCYVAEGRLSLNFYMRSSDVFLGLPFNIASYALLTHMIAQQCDLDVGELIYSGADVHLYSNHMEQALTQLKRIPLSLPVLHLNKAANIDSYSYNDVALIGYECHGRLPAPVAV